jgi:hypothetical protein
MKEIQLSPLDEVLLTQNKVTIEKQIPSKVVRGFASLEITVIQITVDDFIIKTVLYEERRDSEKHVYRGSKSERNAKLTELDCPSDLEAWVGEITSFRA